MTATTTSTSQGSVNDTEARRLKAIEHQERLRQLRIIEEGINRAASLDGGVGGRYNGQYLEVGPRIYEVFSREARSFVNQCVRNGSVVSGHINLYKEQNPTTI
jgi:hypothetical protein